ncbi:MAG TPA: sigma-70 family RNA polymerase sigma factor [Anaerolineaceae bacterium]|jgi:RNA polymerase sigma-70 factor (ECF subfamily)|nr:sigma-70 family RNA polymerase sigma factor [Anaerolineaceae bacterium]
MVLTEKDLLSGARSFDLDMLGVIYDRYSSGIYRYAMRLLGDENLAEDCVSETFSRFLKALRAGQGPRDHLQAYLYRIAHNWITDSYRRHPPRLETLVETLHADADQQPEAQVGLHQEQQQVQLALQALTPDQRQVVTLRFIEGWENNAVAAALGKPVSAIKALQHRALLGLRKLLTSGGQEQFDESQK